MKEEKTGPRNKRSRRKKRIWIGLSCLFAAVVLAGFLYIQSRSFKSFLIEKAGEYLESRYNLTLTAASFDFSIFRLSVDMADIEVRRASSGEPALVELFTARKLSFDTTPLTLLGRKIHIQNFRLLHPHLEIKSIGGNTSSLKATGAPEKPLSLRIERFKVEEGSLKLRDKEYSLSSGISNLQVEIEYLNSTGKHAGLIRAEAGAIRFGEKLFPIRKFNGGFTFDDETVEFRELDLQMDSLSVKASGKISDYRQIPEYRLNLDGTIQLERIAEILGLGNEYAGSVFFECAVDGYGKDTNLKGNIEGGDIMGAGISVARIEADFDTDTKDLTVDSVKVVTQEGSLRGKLKMSLTGRDESTAEASWNSIELSLFEKLAPRIIPMLEATSKGELKAKWKDRHPKETDASVDIRFAPRPPSADTGKKRYGLEGRLRLEAANGAVHIKPSALRLDRTQLSLSGKMDETKIFHGAFQIEAPDLREVNGFLRSMIEQKIIPGEDAAGLIPSRGAVSINGAVRGGIKNPQVKLDVEGKDIGLKKVQINRMNLDLAYARPVLEINELRLKFAQGQIRTQGRLVYDLRSRSFGKGSEFRIDADRIDLEPFFSIVPLDHSVRGMISAAFTVSGSPDDPAVLFEASGDDLAFDRETLSRFECKGSYEERKLSLEQIRLAKGDGTMEGSLEFDLFTGEYAVHLKGRSIELSGFEESTLQNDSLSGTVRFRLQGEGSLKKPVFELDFSIDKSNLGAAALGRIGLEAKADGHSISLKMGAPAVRTSLEAHLLLREPLVVRGKIETEALDLWHTMRAHTVPLPSPVSTEISGKAEFAVPVMDWPQASVRIDLETLALRHKKISLKNPQPFSLRYENQELSWESAAFEGTETHFSISGSLPFGEENQGRMFMDGSVNLKILETVLPVIDAGGSLIIQSEISGTLMRPLLNARITLQNGAFRPAALPLAFHDIEIESGIENNQLTLEKLSAGVAGGNISAEGTIDLNSLIEKDLKAPSKPVKNPPNEAILTFEGLDLKGLAALLPEKPAAEMGGGLAGFFRFHGDFSSPERIHMEGALTKLDLILSRFRMANEGDIRLRMEAGVLRMERLKLIGRDSFLEADMTLSLSPAPNLDARLETAVDVSKLTPLFEDLVMEGKLAAGLECRGPLDDLILNGSGGISKGLFRVKSFPLLVTDIKGSLAFPEKNQLRFTLSGILNGGKTDIEGRTRIGLNRLQEVDIGVKADQVQLSYPEGLQALADADLFLGTKEQNWFLTGQAELTRSFFGADIYPGSELIKSLRSQRRALQSDIPPSIRGLNLGLDVTTVDPFIVDNNLASLEMEGKIRIGGTVYEPRLTGFLRNRQTGEVIFNNRSFEVEQAAIDFPDSDPLDGLLNITAHTQLRYDFKSYDVTLGVTGPVTELRFTLSSYPSMSEIDLVLILLTGHGTERLKNEAANIIGNQMMLYFLSPIASPFTNTLKNLIGAEEVRIEPINIATEADPGARFTFRKGLVSSLDLIYSIDISNTQNQTWVLDYDLSRHFTIRSFARDDGTYGGSFSHRFTLGEKAQAGGFSIGRKGRRYRIADIQYGNTAPFTRKTLADKTKPLKTGTEFNYGDLREAIDSLTSHYKKNGFLNAVISPSIVYEDQNKARILFDIKRNNPASLIFIGDPIRNELKKRIRDRWNGRLPEEMSMSEAEKHLRLELNSRGCIQAEVSLSKTEEDSESFYVIFVHFGPRYRIKKFTLSQESAVTPEAIKKAVSSIPKSRGKGLWALLYDFKRARLRIESLYEELGHRNVSIGHPEISPDHEEKTIDIVLPVEQGPRIRIQSIRIKGNKAFLDPALLPLLALKSGSLFSPGLLSTDTNMLYSFYREKGYQNVRIDVQPEKEPGSNRIDLIYSITEGELLTISGITISGNRRTPAHVIRRELVFHEGEPLNLEDIITSQKNLYDLMVFDSVNIYQSPEKNRSDRIRVEVEVRESPPLQIRYGLRYNSEEKIEGFAELDLVNILGRGRNGLLFYRQNKREKDLRFSIEDPYLFGKKMNTLYSLFYLEKTQSVFKSEEFGFSIQQELAMPFESKLSYLFRYNRTHTYELDPIGPFPFDITLSLPEFQVFWLSDTRDNLINTKRGSFLSLSLKYSPSFLKTDLTYISFFGQYSFFIPVRPFFIWASNFRLGIADAFDQILVPSRRFYAGGANSIRGFERDTVGPFNLFLQQAEGGEAVFIINQELRFPVLPWLEAVTFFDMGNVYASVGDFNPLDFRASLGMGLRLDLPVVFLRLDYGFNLSPREFESGNVFYISIGQAF